MRYVVLAAATGGHEATQDWLCGTRELLERSLDAFARFNVGVTADMDPGASGEMGSMVRDVPTLQVITLPEIKHTEQGTPEWVPSSGLEQRALACARIIDEVNRLERGRLQPGGGPGTQAR
jgi:hypothetical protein